MVENERVARVQSRVKLNMSTTRYCYESGSKEESEDSYAANEYRPPQIRISHVISICYTFDPQYF